MQPRKTNQLAVPDLHPGVLVRSLLDAFLKHEKEITSVKLSKQRREGELQVGYVEFCSVDATEKAYGDGSVKIGGETKTLHYAKRKDPRKDKVIISGTKLFVSGISGSASKGELSTLLGNCKISGEDSGKSYIFAEYEDHESQEKALRRINDSEFKGARLYATPAFEKPGLSTLGKRKGEVN